MKNLKFGLIAIIAVIAVIGVSAMSADDGRPISFEALPDNSKEFIVRYFDPEEIAFAQKEREIFDVSYEVFFTDGSKVEFDRKGEWESIDFSKARKAIPTGIIPEPIEAYVQKNHSDHVIVKIDRDKLDLEIELNNGLEIKFNKKYQIIGYDD